MSVRRGKRRPRRPLDLGREPAEETLPERDLRFRAFVEQAPVAIAVSRHGTLLYANRRFAEMIGREDVEELVGAPVNQAFAPNMQEASKERSRRRSLGLPVPAEYDSVLKLAMVRLSQPTLPSGSSSSGTAKRTLLS